MKIARQTKTVALNTHEGLPSLSLITRTTRRQKVRKGQNCKNISFQSELFLPDFHHSRSLRQMVVDVGDIAITRDIAV